MKLCHYAIMNSFDRHFNLVHYWNVFWLSFPILPSFSPSPIIYISDLGRWSEKYITDPEQYCLLIDHLICLVHFNFIGVFVVQVSVHVWLVAITDISRNR